MGKVAQVQAVIVSHPERTAGSSFALPGQNLPPVYLATQYQMRAVVMEDLTTWVGIVQGSVWANGVRAAPDYTMGAWLRTSNWAWSYAGGRVVVPAGAVQWGSATIAVTAGTGTGSSSVTGLFNWDFPNHNANGAVDAITVGSDVSDDQMSAAGFYNLGQLAGFEGDGTGTAYVYVSGIGTYGVTNPIYPAPARIAIPNIRLVIEDYYPWARNTGGGYVSYNASGHYLQRLPGVNLKNKVSGDGSHVYKLADGAWQVMPKLG